MKVVFRVLVFILLPIGVFAQNITDSLKLNNKPKFVFQIDVRNSFIADNSAYKKMIYGFWAGLDYSKKHIYTFGLYTTNNPFKPLDIIYKKASTGAIIKQYYNFELYFASLGYQYIYFNKYNIKMSCPIEIGFGLGRAYVERHWIDNDKLNSYEVSLYAKFIPVQIGYAIEWKATRWFGLNSQIGYRKSLFTDLLNDNQNIDYDGLYYTYGIRLYFGKIFKDGKSYYQKKKDISIK